MSIYKPSVVIELEEFYGDLLFATDKYPNLVNHLASLSHRLFEGIQVKHDPLYVELNNYHKGFIGQSVEELKSIDVTLDDCHDVISQEYGFGNWNTLSKRTGLLYNPIFEHAINQLLEGNSQTLKVLLQDNPELVQDRSPYGHGATLLHYAGSNGVEMWRQKVPMNLTALIEILLEAGADKNATMNVYGGHFTTLELLITSAHPYAAGIVDDLKRVLK